MRLFISYSHVDRSFCDQLVGLLDAHEVWYDKMITGGTEWWQTILEKIEWCEGFVYLLSPESIASDYCIQECRIALNSGREIFPVIIRDRVQVPKFLSHIQYVNMSRGIDIKGYAELSKALLEAERRSGSRESDKTLDNLAYEDYTPPQVAAKIDTPYSQPYNYIFRLRQRKASQLTQKVYSRWVCEFLEFAAGEKRISPKDRFTYLSRIPDSILVRALTVSQVKAWLMSLIANDRRVDQAKSAIITLADLLQEDDLVEDTLVYKLKQINVSGNIKERRPRKILGRNDIDKLIQFALLGESLSDRRDAVIVTLLLVLRSGELIKATWENIDRAYDFKKTKGLTIKLPKVAKDSLKEWRDAIDTTANTYSSNSLLIRRFVRKDNLTEFGITKTTVNTVLRRISQQAGLGNISPEDLRISAQKISQKVEIGDIF